MYRCFRFIPLLELHYVITLQCCTNYYTNSNGLVLSSLLTTCRISRGRRNLVFTWESIFSRKYKQKRVAQDVLFVLRKLASYYNMGYFQRKNNLSRFKVQNVLFRSGLDHKISVSPVQMLHQYNLMSVMVCQYNQYNVTQVKS